MTDRAFEPPNPDPFAQIIKDSGWEPRHSSNTSPDVSRETSAPSSAKGAENDPFASLLDEAGFGESKFTRLAPLEPDQDETSASGAFARGAAKGALPAIGSLPAIGAGAEIGATLGPWGAVAGGLIGGLGGGYALSAAQHWALSNLPTGWQDALGVSDRQAQLDEAEHPVASFLGGLAPYAMTMRPGAIPKTPLPENATALQRVMANPATARLFGGAAMGGIELGQEAAQGDVDWRKAAVATGFGVVFNRPTRIGERLTEIGAAPARRMLGRPDPLAAVPPYSPSETTLAPSAEAAQAIPPEPSQPAKLTADQASAILRGHEAPTVAQATNARIIGPGVTEQVFLGSHGMAEAAQASADETMRVEQMALDNGPKVTPDAVLTARRMHPELFAAYDELTDQHRELKLWEAEEPASEAPKQHLSAVEDQLREMEPQIAAAYRRAAEAAGASIVEPRPVRYGVDLFAEAPQPRTIDRSHDVPYLAGSNNAGGVTYIDRRVPTEMTIGDKTFDPAKYLAVHEETEHDLMTRRGMAYEAAHREALKAEQAAVQKDGIDWSGYQDRMHKLAEQVTEKEKAENPPADLYTKPYPHEQAEFLKRQGEKQAERAPAAVAPDREPPRPKTIEEQKRFIFDDVREKLIRAGRDPAEARNAAALIADRYETRAARMNGVLGTAEELYNREAPYILKHGERSPYVVKGPRRYDESKLSLVQYLGVNGGLKPSAEIRDIFDKQNPMTPQGALLRQNGMSEEDALRLAIDAGYIQDIDPTRTGGIKNRIDDLHAALKQESMGKRVYRPGHEPPAETAEEPIRPQGPLPEAGAAEARSHLMTPEDEEAFAQLNQIARGGVVLNPEGIPGRDWLGVPDTKPVLRMLREANASTFIHESGHLFLAELMRDAAHEQAPADLKADAQAALKWLGVDKSENLARRHHEKFATGFEQYLREGIAPSPRLASVFAQFKDWLLQIYQTLRGLGEPINEDIKGVFDRLLAIEPQRTIIGEAHPRSASLADIHETDAAHTLPEHAEGLRDMGAAEWERHQPPPHTIEEINEAFARDAATQAETNESEAAPGTGGDVLGGQAGAVAGPGGAVRQGGSGPEPVTGSGGLSAPSGPFGPSDQRPGTEGAGSRTAAAGAAERTEPARPAAQDNPLASEPADTFPAHPAFNLGRDGNVRAENITNARDFITAINDAASRNPGGGAMTMADMLALEGIGIDPKTVNLGQLQDIFGGVINLNRKVWELRTAVEAQSGTVHQLAQKIAQSNLDSDVLAYARERDRFDMMYRVLSSVTTEVGRAQGMGFRPMAQWEGVKNLAQTVKQNTGMTLFQLKDEAKLISTLDTPAKVANVLKHANARSGGGMLLEYWINSLISGPWTHASYMVGNTISNGIKATIETPLASAIGALRASRGRQGEFVRGAETFEQLKGMIRGLPAAMQAGLEGWRTGMTTRLPGELARPLTPFQGDAALTIARQMTNDPVTWKEFSADFFAYTRSLLDGLKTGAALVAAGGEPGSPLLSLHYSPLGQVADIAFRGVPLKVLPGGTMMRLPSRGVAAIHSFFRNFRFIQAISGTAYRDAMAELEAGKIDSHQFDGRLGELRSAPSDERMEQARKDATETTLMAQGGHFVEAVQKLVNTKATLPFLGETAPLKFIDPFVHIGANVINQAVVQRTPLGLLSAELRADLLGKNGNVAQDMAQARMLAGTALSLAFGAMAMNGWATGSGPKDPEEAARWRAVYQPHSVRIGDLWYQVNHLGPMGMLMGIAADMYDVAHEATTGDMLTAAAHLQHAVTQNILDESFMRGPADLIKAIEDSGRYGENYLKGMISSFVPFSVGMYQMARAADPYSRQARNIVDSIKAKIPGLSQQLLPRLDNWGEEIPNPHGLAYLTAIWEKRVNTDPVNQAMLDLGVKIAQPERKIRNVELTEQQYYDFSRIAGRMTKLRLDTIVRSPDYQRWPNHVKHDVIKLVIEQNREAARGMMMARYPQIAQTSYQMQRDRLKD